MDALESATKKIQDKTLDTDADADVNLDVTVQTGLYATEMFAANLELNYLLHIVVVNNVPWIWYYDQQLPRFMVLFLEDLLGRGESEIVNKIKEIVKVHNTVKDHISELLWHHQFTNPTSAIREALGVPEILSFGAQGFSTSDVGVSHARVLLILRGL
ncbi:hypothetical protein F4604DRAFT_1926874 [Suillus subluteus]|nr:hypothetical protein F4604DRAFT_1926874 [Suillus subluteus]